MFSFTYQCSFLEKLLLFPTLKFKTQNVDFNQFYQTRATVGGEAGNFQGYVELNTSFIPKEWLQFARLIFTTMVAFLFPQKLIELSFELQRQVLITTTTSLEAPISKNRNLFSVTEFFFFYYNRNRKIEISKRPSHVASPPCNTGNPQPRSTVMSLDPEIPMPIPLTPPSLNSDITTTVRGFRLLQTELRHAFLSRAAAFYFMLTCIIKDIFKVKGILCPFYSNCAMNLKCSKFKTKQYLGFFLISSNWPTTWETLVRIILKAISSSPMISNLIMKT